MRAIANAKSRNKKYTRQLEKGVIEVTLLSYSFIASKANEINIELYIGIQKKREIIGMIYEPFDLLFIS